ncbi:MAG: Hpt domain-containing protein, partial [Acidimicrobiia bacterium]|nr:Hpt domain-containing protein [Acidimicrobiia bacterium]
MDWGDSAELHDIFVAEVADRASTLLQAARAIKDGTYVPSPTNDRTRDAHTVKGSSRVMGFDYAADAAQEMEEVWRRIESGDMEPYPGLGTSLEAVTTAMQSVVEDATDQHFQHLSLAVATLRRLVDGNGVTGGDDAVAATNQPDIAAAFGQVSSDRSVGAAPASESNGHKLTTETVVDMGGLLSSIHDHLTGGSTRIDSGKLYQLINQSVELRLDVQALTSTMERVRDIVEGSDGQLAADFEKATRMVETSLHNIQERALDLASVRLKEITASFPQLMRYVARKTGKEVRFEISGEDIEIDRQILERLHEPIRHLLVNAIDHGIEPPAVRQAAGKPPTGLVALRVSASGNRLELLVQDDGSGIDWDAIRARGRDRQVIDPEHLNDQSELARLLFLPGFSTCGE